MSNYLLYKKVLAKYSHTRVRFLQPGTDRVKVCKGVVKNTFSKSLLALPEQLNLMYFCLIGVKLYVENSASTYALR